MCVPGGAGGFSGVTETVRASSAEVVVCVVCVGGVEWGDGTGERLTGLEAYAQAQRHMPCRVGGIDLSVAGYVN